MMINKTRPEIFGFTSYINSIFQVSRVVIREAIWVLELRGFVALRQGPSGGAFVAELSLQQLSGAFQDLFLTNKLSAKELVQVRLHIEPEITRLAALRASKTSRERLEQAYKAEHTVMPPCSPGKNLFLDHVGNPKKSLRIEKDTTYSAKFYLSH